MTPSQKARRRKAKPKRTPGERYTVAAYGRAVARGCARAFRFPFPENLSKKDFQQWRKDRQEEIQQWQRVHRWHPNQLRHTKATEIRREAGLDAARAVLGHRTPAITEVYAELDMSKAAEVMERLGKKVMMNAAAARFSRAEKWTVSSASRRFSWRSQRRHWREKGPK